MHHERGVLHDKFIIALLTVCFCSEVLERAMRRERGEEMHCQLGVGWFVDAIASDDELMKEGRFKTFDGLFRPMPLLVILNRRPRNFRGLLLFLSVY